MQRFAVIASLAAFGCNASNPEPVGGEPLQIGVLDDAVIEGSFAHGGSFLQFRSVLVDQHSAMLQLDVNGILIDAAIDLASMQFSQDGHLNALYEEDRQVLAAFSIAFGDAYPSLVDGPLHGKLLLRHADRLADAPNGYTLDRRVIDMNAISQPILNTGASCGNDGVTCLAGVHGYANAYFDKANAGCVAYYRQYGKYEPSCAGRCGNGCLSWDRNYTQDCFDHDWCTKIVSGAGSTGSDPNCGDEFWHADDDYAASYNLYLCGNR